MSAIPKRECPECKRFIFNTYKEDPHATQALFERMLPDPCKFPGPPNIVITKRVAYEQRNAMAELGEFVAWVLGKPWPEICLADMLFYMGTYKTQGEKMAALEEEIAELKRQRDKDFERDVERGFLLDPPKLGEG